MEVNTKISKVEILIQQNRFAEAERILKELLSADSTNVFYLMLLAEVYGEQEKYDLANNILDNAIGLAPDMPELFYVKAKIAINQNKLAEAEKNINQSLSLDSNNAQYYALVAYIKLNSKQYSEALEHANKSLEIDSENIMGLNVRSTALLKLDRKEESFITIEGALREDPTNSYTHSNYGWGLLEKGEHKKALEHFKEALKNNPNFEYAQAGMLEAIKATNPAYKLYLKYSFWMSNMQSKYQWGVILGFYFGTRILQSIAKKNEWLQPYLYPIIILLALFAFSTWVIQPIGNLFLRFNKYGQLLLNKKEKMSSNFVAVSFAIFITGILLYFILKDDKFLAMAFVGFAMMIPLSVLFRNTTPKNVLLIYTSAMTIIGILAIVNTFMTGILINNFSLLFLLSFLAFQFLANIVATKNR